MNPFDILKSNEGFFSGLFKSKKLGLVSVVVFFALGVAYQAKEFAPLALGMGSAVMVTCVYLATATLLEVAGVKHCTCPKETGAEKTTSSPASASMPKT